jgi:protein-S-isoprenylcysteine O-methyltransferase Ste14
LRRLGTDFNAQTEYRNPLSVISFRSPDIGMALVILSSFILFLALPVWGWGDLGGYFAHPARVGASVVMVLTTLAVGLSGAKIGQLFGTGKRTAVMLLVVAIYGFLFGWLPPHADRRGFLTVDGDLARYTGLALLIAGCILRVGPMFDLGNRFRPPWLKQEEHRLVTGGFYRHVRNPSYLGGFLGMIGWFLLFRCGVGFLFALLALPASIPLIRKEEAKLEQEFGPEYTAYKQRTWRLIPFIN